MLLMRAVFMRHNRSSFQVVCFSTRFVSGHERRHWGEGEVGWGGGAERVGEGEGSGNGVPEGCAEAHELGADGDKGRAQMINGREIHVVVDLNGWTGGHVMGALAFKPAPLIINYMGFAGSTGARFVDYAAFDPVVAPPEHTSHFTESLLLLPLSYFVTDFMRSDFSAPQDAGAQEKVRAEEEEMAQVGKAEGLMPAAVRVCNHDQAYKLDPSRFTTWCRIARSNRTTQLWLLRQDARVEARVRAAAPPHLRTRLVFAAKVGVRAHIRRIRLCQLALDTASIGAHTTAANYLWARVPVVTVPGMHVMSRVAASLLVALARDSREQNRNRVCSPVTVARSESEYVGIARALVKAAAARAVASGRGVADKDMPKLPQALMHTHARVLECLRAATEPLDARSASSSAASSSAPSRDMMRAPAVFNTARWVRDWERALMTALDLSLSCQEYWGHWTRGEGRRSHGHRLSLPHVIVS